MKTQPFVHLHVHTCYSLLDGACRIEDLVKTAAQNNMPAMAMTDHGVMYGIIDFYKTARNGGIKPILGLEAYITSGSRLDRGAEAARSLHHIVLLAKDLAGYLNLVKLTSKAHLEGFYYKPRIDRELLSAHCGGLVGLSACLQGEVAEFLVADDMKSAIRVAGEYAEMFGKDGFFLEVMDHGIPEQRKVNALLKDVAARVGIRTVATNDVHYLKKEHAAAHEVLLCLQTQTVLSDPKRMRFQTEQFYMKTREEMEAIFRGMPEALDTTLEIAEMCNVELEFGKLHFPKYDVPKGTNQPAYLAGLGHEGLRKLYDIKDPAKPQTDVEKAILKRFDMEMEVIRKTGFVNYFLVVWDFVRFAREHGIPVGPGRGSGGGSLVAYALGITAIDPLRYDLIFERFLNPERVSPPDFDIDFCQARRGEVIEYVKGKYGRENVAQIMTFGSLGPKTVIRDVGRVLEIPYGKCDLLSKMVPEDPKMTLHKALEESPDFKRTYEADPDCKRIMDYAFVLEGLYRNTGTHAAGVVIGEQPLIEIIPLARDKDNQPITQYAMEPIGDIGLLKMDFLGLRTLTVMDEAVKLIARTRGEAIELDRIPFDNKPAYDLLNKGDTVAVFQLESNGMRDLIRRVGIDKIEDLIAMIALFRPGPMNMLEDYIARKTHKAKIQYEHPLLEPILKETYGVFVYQEQVQKAANILAGYSLGEADILRRAMGKKKVDVMEAQRAKFVKGCMKTTRISEDKAGKLFDTIARFAEYGFNKAHSAGYAVIAYQTAYLKANYPAEFMSAVLSSEMGNSEKLPVFVAEAAGMGLKILPPDVNSSGVRFEPSGDTIRYGLAGIKNVGEGAAESVVAERGAGGPFTGLLNFCSRMDGQLVNKKVLESLIRCGGFDSTGMHRARLFSSVDFAMSRASSSARDRRSGQRSLFDMMAKDESTAVEDIPDAPKWSESELLAGEHELLGTYLSGHPLTQYADILGRYQLTTVKGFAGLADRQVTRIGGIVAKLVRRFTKEKKPMATFQLEDLDGSLDVVAYSEVLQKYGAMLVEGTAVIVCGSVRRDGDRLSLISQEVYALADAPRLFAKKISIHVPLASAKDGKLDRIREILAGHPGTTPVVLCLMLASGEKVFMEADSSHSVVAEEELLKKLEHELGEKSVYVSVDTTPCRAAKAGPRNGRAGSGDIT